MPKMLLLRLLILLRKFAHDWIDGRSQNPLGLTARQFKIYLLNKIKIVYKDRFEFQRALDEIEKLESEKTIKYLKNMEEK